MTIKSIACRDRDGDTVTVETGSFGSLGGIEVPLVTVTVMDNAGRRSSAAYIETPKDARKVRKLLKKALKAHAVAR